MSESLPPATFHVTPSGQLWEELQGHELTFVGEFLSREVATREALRRAVRGRGDRIVVTDPLDRRRAALVVEIDEES